MVDVQVSLYKIKFTSNSNPQAQVQNPESREKIAEIEIVGLEGHTRFGLNGRGTHRDREMGRQRSIKE